MKWTDRRPYPVGGSPLLARVSLFGDPPYQLILVDTGKRVVRVRLTDLNPSLIRRIKSICDNPVHRGLITLQDSEVKRILKLADHE